jgi:hypothetical protein
MRRLFGRKKVITALSATLLVAFLVFDYLYPKFFGRIFTLMSRLFGIDVHLIRVGISIWVAVKIAIIVGLYVLYIVAFVPTIVSWVRRRE